MGVTVSEQRFYSPMQNMCLIQVDSLVLSSVYCQIRGFFFDIAHYLFSGTADCRGMSSALHKGASSRQKLKQNLLRGDLSKDRLN